MHANVKVLVVDDNPMVLALLTNALSMHAKVSTASDGADALMRVIDEPFDLIVSDYQMPGMDGRQLLEKIRSRAATSRIPLILVASKTDLTEKLKVVQDSVEDFVEKPFFVKEATARIKRIIDKIALEKMAKEAPASDGKLRGSLAQMNVLDLLQSLDMGKKTCLLTLTNNNNDRCDMYFSDGQISHAVYGALKGDDAVYKILSWQDGNFQLDFNGQSSEQTTTRSTQGLLMEGLRLLDESAREGEEDVLES
jgi:DNA-binding response OmpR family regulator